MATLLIVDDDNKVRDTLLELFVNEHECHTADRAEQAIAFLEFEEYDAILTDISMPGLSGRDLLQRVHQRHPKTPVIVISGMSDENEGQALIEMGAFAFFSKPFNLDEIESTVSRAIAARASDPHETSNESPA